MGHLMLTYQILLYSGNFSRGLYVFRVFRDLTKSVNIFPVNLLISQHKHIIPARKS